MLLTTIGMLQAFAASPPEKIDLTIPNPCSPQSDGEDEIVVCGRADGKSPYRLEPLPDSGTGSPRAQVQLGGEAALAAETEQGEVGGIPTNRLMVRFKVKF